MRKLQTQEEIDKKKKRNAVILSSIMLSLLLLSTLGFAFLSNPNSSINNQNQQNIPQNPQQQNPPTDRISINYQGSIFNLQSSQSDIENITVNVNITPQDYSGQPLYLDIANQGILQEIISTIGRFASRVQEACHGKCDENLPEKNCSSNLIVWSESTENRVYQEDSCIFILGDLNAADAFIYNILK
jgi:hypothetical protein